MAFASATAVLKDDELSELPFVLVGAEAETASKEDERNDRAAWRMLPTPNVPACREWQPCNGNKD